MLLASTVLGRAIAEEAATPPPEPPSPTRIMLYGDSYAMGFSGDWTVRFRLWQRLVDSGTEFDFVGPRTDVRRYSSWRLGSQAYRYPDFDRDHAGMGGMTFTDPLWSVSSLVSEHQADVVVGIVGYNDLARGVATPAELADEWRRQIGLIRQGAPGTDVVLVPIPAVWFPVVAEYDDELATVAQELDQPASRVVVAPLTPFDMATDSYDRVHPGPAGEEKLANAIAAALADLGIGGSAASLTATDNPRTARFAPSVSVSAADGPTLRLSWKAVDYASAEDVVVQDVTGDSSSGWRVVAARRLRTTSWSLDVVAGHRYRVWLMPVKGYQRMGTRSPKVTVEVP